MNKFNIKSLTQEQKNTRQRILEISFQRNFSHIGSCLSSVDLVDAVYRVKKKNEKFILSNGHAGIALYVILEKNGLIKNHDITNSLNVHPDRNPEIGIDVSTGSLGQGLPIALGIALANRKENVYCLISDGECAEGSIWETLRIASENEVVNLKIIVNANGWSAYDPVELDSLVRKFKAFDFVIRDINGNDMKSIVNAIVDTVSDKKPTIIFARTFTDQFPFLKGLDCHYYLMTNKDYQQALGLLK